MIITETISQSEISMSCHMCNKEVKFTYEYLITNEGKFLCSRCYIIKEAEKLSMFGARHSGGSNSAEARYLQNGEIRAEVFWR